jgi:hypothetical protein
MQVVAVAALRAGMAASRDALQDAAGALPVEPVDWRDAQDALRVGRDARREDLCREDLADRPAGQA